MNADPLLERFNFFQTAYAVSDIEEAIRVATRFYGIDKFQVNRNARIHTKEGEANLHFALAFVGDAQIELIQPAGGKDGAYRRVLPNQGFAMRLHHFGHLTTDAAEWEGIVAAVKESGFDMPVGGIFVHEGVPLMHYLYADTRETLGHHLEFMFQTPHGKDLFSEVPRHALRAGYMQRK